MRKKSNNKTMLKTKRYSGSKKDQRDLKYGLHYTRLEESERSEEGTDNSDRDDEDRMNQDKSNHMSMDLDGVFNYIGHCGFYQIGVGFMLCLLNTAPAYQVLIMYFTNYSPPWKCSASKQAMDECQLRGIIGPSRMEEYDLRCRMKRGSWEYAGPEMKSFATEFNLICGKAGKATLASSAFYLGWAVGSLPTGVISDSFGRKPIMVVSTVILLLSSFLSGYVYAIWHLTALRFITGICMTGASLNPYVILTEIVGPKFRPLAGSAYFLWTCLSLVLLTFQAYIIRNWRTLFVLTSAPYALLLVFVIFIPESVRWLHLNGKAKKVSDLLNSIADANGKDVQPMMLRAIETKAQGAFIDLFTPSKVLKRTAIQGFHWCVLGMTYYGISLASADLTGNIYRDFVLIAIAELPCIYVVVKTTELYGRQRTVVWSFLCTALCCLVLTLSTGETNSEIMVLIRVASAIVGKFFVSTAFNAYYIWSSELHPTVIRLQAMSFVVLMARLGAAMAPVLTTVLNLINPAFPFAVMGLSCVVSASSGMLLSETRGKPTMETIEDLLKDDDYVELSGLRVYKTQRESSL